MDSINLKENWRDFEKVVKKNNIKSLHHITAYENLASIKEKGLYSWDYCKRNKIEINRPGGNKLSRKLDKDAGLENYVRLCFHPYPPFVFELKKSKRIKNPYTLFINPSVIYWEKTQFCNQNAASHIALVGSDLNSFESIHFDKAMRPFNSRDNVKNKDLFQAEVLVYEHIPCEYIKEVKRLTFKV